MKFGKIILKLQLFIILFLPFSTFASTSLMIGMSTQNNNFWLPISGSQNIYFTYTAIMKTVDGHMPALQHGDGWIKRGVRLAKWLVLDQNLAQLAAVGEHEIFGHGFQSVDAGNNFFVFIDYPLIFPLFSGVTATFGDDPALSKNESSHLQASINLTAGGINSNLLTERVIIADNIRKETFTVYDANYYLGNVMGGNVYTIVGLASGTSGDSYQYIKYNSRPTKVEIFPTGSPQSYTIDFDISKSLKNRLIIYSSVAMVLDPVLWKSFFSIFHYINTGQVNGSLPYWTSWKILPKIDITLAPYGPEINYTVYMNSLYIKSVTLRHSDGMFGTVAGGMDIVTSDYKVFKKFRSLFVSMSASLWAQPQLSLRALKVPVIKVKNYKKWESNPDDTSNNIPFGLINVYQSRWNKDVFGGALGFSLGYAMTKKLAAIFTLQEKTQGFLLGNSYEPETRVLFSLRFD